MRRIIYLFLTIPVFLISCESSPDASFSVDRLDPEVGQEVFFSNHSLHAQRFEWNFGDGTFSNDENPVHIYTGSGSFEVQLTAFSKNGNESKAYQIIDVLVPTLLEVEVLEFYDGYPVENASVLIYPTLSDWDNETNSLMEGFTDINGIVVFSGLEKFVYYLDIWEAHHNNYTLRDDNVSFIRTPEVLPHQINRFTAYVDYVAGTKGDAKRDRTMKIKRIVRR